MAKIFQHHLIEKYGRRPCRGCRRRRPPIQAVAVAVNRRSFLERRVRKGERGAIQAEDGQEEEDEGETTRPDEARIQAEDARRKVDGLFMNYLTCTLQLNQLSILSS